MPGSHAAIMETGLSRRVEYARAFRKSFLLSSGGSRTSTSLTHERESVLIPFLLVAVRGGKERGRRKSLGKRTTIDTRARAEAGSQRGLKHHPLPPLILPSVCFATRVAIRDPHGPGARTRYRVLIERIRAADRREFKGAAALSLSLSLYAHSSTSGLPVEIPRGLNSRGPAEREDRTSG